MNNTPKRLESLDALRGFDLFLLVGLEAVMHALDGATFPHIIKVQYVVGEVTYVKRKWIGAGKTVPAIGSKLTVCYCSDKPSKAKVL